MNGDKIMFEINGHTKQLGIIGYPVEHTFSPNMHNFKPYITTMFTEHGA